MKGIYIIKNLITGKIYIGKTTNYINRVRHHVYCLKHNKHHSSHLQNSWNKYGEKAFVFGMIEEYPKDQLDKYEKYWIDYYNSYNDGYNEAIPNGKNNGRIYNKKAIETHSKAMKAYYKTVSDEDKKAWGKHIHTFKREYNPKQLNLKLYNKNLELVKELSTKECADYLGVTPRRLLKSMNKIRNERGICYKNYIIIKETETLEEFLEDKLTSRNKWVIGGNNFI